MGKSYSTLLKPTRRLSLWRRFWCALGCHSLWVSKRIKYLGMTKYRRNIFGVRIYKSFLDRYRCECGAEFERWT